MPSVKPKPQLIYISYQDIWYNPISAHYILLTWKVSTIFPSSFNFFSVCILSCMKCLLVKKECHLGATWHAFFITLEQKKPLLLWMNSYRSNAGVFTRPEMFQPLTLLWIVYLDLYYIFRLMGRAGSVHTGSLWTQMILNLRTNTMAVLIITTTLGAKNTVTLCHTKVPFWSLWFCCFKM